jgi:predicted transcriptional regulator
LALAGVVPPKRPNGKAYQGSKKESFGPGVKARVSQCLAMRALGMTDKEIADHMQISINSLHQYMWVAGKRGYLSQTHPDTRMKYEVPDKIVRNVVEMLDHPNIDVRKEMTLEAAKGTGLFRQHQAIKQEGVAAMSAIQVQVIMPQGVEQPVVDGSIGGVEADYTDDTSS